MAPDPLSPEEIDATLRGLVGQQLPGGCEDCGHSWHEYVADEDAGGVHILIHHDETCPQLRSEA